MTITFTLAPEPIWYLADNTGRPAGGAKMFAYRSLNKTQIKNVYQDPAGNFPWDQSSGILFNLNGSQGPFYWEFDTDTPDETYYLRFLDSQDNLLFDIDDFTPGSSGGGGGNITQYVSLKNYLTNGGFWRNQGSINGAGENVLLAPSNHSAFLRPHIQFHKNSTSNTDNISFPTFPLGSDPFTGDVTPHNTLRINCITSNPGETYKYIEFPICPNVSNFDNQVVTVTLWAINEGGGTPSLDIEIYNYYGSQGGSTPDSVSQSISPSSSWQKFILNFTVPNAASKTIGACGDDALYFRINYPINTAFNIRVGKPSFYLGDVVPDIDFDSYDQVDSIINSAQTADIRITPSLLNNRFHAGWIPMNDGTIGSATSGATTRANLDTFFLYKILWQEINDLYAPVIGGKGSSAEHDFSLNKPITLTKMLGRVLAGTVTPNTAVQYTVDTGTNILTFASTPIFKSGMPITVFTNGGTLPAPLITHKIYYIISLSATTMKLASTFEDSVAATPIPIDITTSGTGTQFIIFGSQQVGFYEGEYHRVMLESQMAQHNHPLSLYKHFAVPSFNPLDLPVGNNTFGVNGNIDLTLDPLSATIPFNTTQPTVFQNIYIKL